MNLKLLIGIVLFGIGLVAGIGGIVGVARSDGRVPQMIVQGNLGLNWSDDSGSAALPLIAGLSLALGGVLIGLSAGNFSNPRTHSEPGDAVVDPEGHRKMKHV